MLFTPKQFISAPLSLSLYVNNTQIIKVTSVKFLGVIIDEKLDWKIHIQDLCLRLRRYVGIFYKLSLKLPPHILKILYLAIIYPRILYGIEVYANTYLTYLHDLMILNNRLLRILQHKKYFTNTIDLYTTYVTLPINILFKYQLLLFAHDIFYKSEKLPKLFYSDRLTNSDVHNYSTHSNQDFHRASENSSYG